MRWNNVATVDTRAEADQIAGYWRKRTDHVGATPVKYRALVSHMANGKYRVRVKSTSSSNPASKARSRYFRTSSAADRYVKQLKAAGYAVIVRWNSTKGGYDVKVLGRVISPASNPAKALPIGKMITVKAIRRRDGRVDLYRA